MKQNKFFILAAAAALFVGCSSDDSISEKAAKQAPQEVGFSAYLNRGTTRAGQTGEIVSPSATPATGQVALANFGVFGYYTNAEFYDQTFTPNFMYNQQVTYSSGWTYAPVKYWPNEFGSNSASDDIDRVSFFAYAPYVTVEPTTGKVKAPTSPTEGDNGDNTYGIVAMKKNTATGDPMVKYITTFYTDKQVDLLWGTVPTGQAWNLKETNAALSPVLTAGKPWLDIQHPNETSVNDASRVKFDFKHALAALNVTVDLKVNKNTVNGFPTDRGTTKVFIRSVTFEGFDTKAALNLNNTTANEALWYTFDCCCEELSKGAETTIQDGRKDGKEGLAQDTKEYAAINPKFVQDKAFASAPAGVTENPDNLFKAAGSTAAGKDDPIYVIPNGDKLKVTIEYDVLTADDNLAGKLNDGTTKGSVVKNVITRYITNSGTGNVTTGDMKLKNGKQYTIKLHLGLNSVEFDAEVSPWDTQTSYEQGGADLPHNN